MRGDGPVWEQAALYREPETGQPISTHSMLKTFRRCPKQAEYKYVQRLMPRHLGRPLNFGKAFHLLLETHYKGENWRHALADVKKQYYAMFEEERDELGDLPRDLERLMTSYLWHYAHEKWIVHEVEVTLECELPDGSIYRCKIDLIVENQWGLWIVDHKTHKKLPDLVFRLLDAQSALYIWCAIKNKIPVQGHIWNYAISKPPSMPVLLKSGKALSRREKLVTDYPHLVRAIKKYDLDPDDYADKLAYLKAQRYEDGAMQTSPFFRRDILEKSNAMLAQVAREGYHTSKRMHSYPWDRPEIIERVPGAPCRFTCSYAELCSLELFGGDTRTIRRSKFSVADPMQYYQDDRMEGTG